ncbi:MAG: 16S rRNA (cytidine(1402)-2'-O)-methyltransferase [Acidobacteria bacterium SCN 69-37]|nr:MAG: 16S rRNA (cytidine(1402)-2'-O)-methyltransferase [Acidobacteria bacterium SCN 69-37]
MPGSLYVVATPIGNLEDLTARARRILGEVDVIAAEDTRRTSRLLAHVGISKPLISLHAHNEHREAPRLVERIRAGASVAVVSDAGTPGISDPGETLVRLCRQAGLPVVAIPGASAVTAALSISGLPAVPFTFLGFPPPAGEARNRWFEALAHVPGAAVFFEAPHRIRRTLDDLLLVKRQIIINRELSKIYENSIEWDNSSHSVPPDVPDRGEFVVVVGPAPKSEPVPIDGEAMLAFVNHLADLPGLSEDRILSAAAAAFQIPVNRVRTTIKKTKILVKQHNK